MSETKNLITAIVISLAILVGWHYFYEAPKARQLKKVAEEQKKDDVRLEKIVEQSFLPKKDILLKSNRIKISTPALHGSISLKGARFDDLTLAGFKQTLAKNSPEVVLLSPSGTKEVYFAEFGWVADKNIDLPNSETIWDADRQTLQTGSPTNLTWINQNGLKFTITINIDEHYMFSIEQKVENLGGKEISLSPYGMVNRTHHDGSAQYAILHEGALGVMGGTLEELTYSNLKEERSKEFKQTSGWLGMTDKYWLTAIIPSTQEKFSAKFNYYQSNTLDRFQADYIAEPFTLPPGKSKTTSVNFFAGAKKVVLLDEYEKKFSIPLFDRAVDFGWLYFLTKPLFYALNHFYVLTGSFGIAILILTVCVKIFMLPLAYKSYQSMGKMKLLQPEIKKLRDSYPDPKDRMLLNKEVMELYKRQKINPLAGCLPLLIQIPVFFALYKVLFVTIEMRHTPFYGWIKDLSAPDPTTIFNLFGLIPWQPPSFLMIGIWPLIMGFTMFFQQKLQPEPTDPVQAKVMKFFPYIFTFILASFPAGLIIYWSWSNTLSIIQQRIITRNERLEKKKAKKGV